VAGIDVSAATDLEGSRSREGEPERQADLRQVQGDPPARAGHGDLFWSAAQAASGV